MEAFLCVTCGTQHAPSAAPPARCPICDDDRQYVGPDGQTWTTPTELARDHALRVGDLDGLLSLDITPAFGIAHRSLLLPTDAGNLLWEPQSLVTDDALAALRAAGGVDRIAVSHPHFHAAMVDWSRALGGVPISIHADDLAWVQRPDAAIEPWAGDTLELSRDVTLIRVGGHFPGSTVLHWTKGPRGRGALFSGDTPQVGLDRRSVSFMYSYPNLVPMPARDVAAIRARLAPFRYGDVYGYTWGRDIHDDAEAAVERSFERYLTAVGA